MRWRNRKCFLMIEVEYNKHKILNKNWNVCANFPQRDFTRSGATVSRSFTDKWIVHMHHQRHLFLQLPRISKEQSESEQFELCRNFQALIWSEVSLWLFLLLTLCMIISGVSEAGEGQWHSLDDVWHGRWLSGHLRLSRPGAECRRRGLAPGDQVQQHCDDPEQHQPHLHRLPDLPHHLVTASHPHSYRS